MNERESSPSGKRWPNLSLCGIVCLWTASSAQIAPGYSSSEAQTRQWSPTSLPNTVAPASALSPLSLSIKVEDAMDDDEAVGGGSINERERTGRVDGPSNGSSLTSTYSPTTARAHLWHALEGLHRYPNYLSRWSERDMDQLERALLDPVDQVRHQRAAVQQARRQADALVQQLLQDDKESGRWKRLIVPPTSWRQVESILDPRASRAIFGATSSTTTSWPTMTLHEVTSGSVPVELPVGPLAALMDEELPDVFSFPLLAPDFCLDLCAYIQALARLDGRIGRRTMNLDTIGLSWLNDLLLALVLRPIARHLFTTTEMGDSDLDWRNGYIAGYSAEPLAEAATRRDRLVTHTDDSEVTLNVCLGEPDFVGGLLEFRGLRGTAEQGHELGTYQPIIGRALIHAGRHFHNVTPVTSGNRFALIVWARSWRGIRSHQCPCCWLNRRQSSLGHGPCICGAQWN
jgi:hypothetical protein